MISWRAVFVAYVVWMAVAWTPFYWSASFWLSSASQPALAILSRANQNLSKSLDFVLNFSSSLKRLAESQTERAQLVGLQSQLSLAEKENALLRQQLKIVPKISPRFILASVIGFSQSEDRIILAVGEKQGIKTGDAAMINGQLIGKVEKLTANRATLLLTTSSQSRWQGINANGQTKGEVLGLFGNRLLLTKILPSQPLALGETILELETKLVVGKVSKILVSGTKLFKEAELTPLWQPAGLTSVLIAGD